MNKILKYFGSIMICIILSIAYSIHCNYMTEKSVSAYNEYKQKTNEDNEETTYKYQGLDMLMQNLCEEKQINKENIEEIQGCLKKLSSIDIIKMNNYFSENNKKDAKKMALKLIQERMDTEEYSKLVKSLNL